MRRALICTALGLLASLGSTGCFERIPAPARPELASFDVTVSQVTWQPPGSATPRPMDVVTTCAARYGGNQAAVPAEERGTPGCRYVLPSSPVQIDLQIVALGRDGQALSGLSRPVTFRVVPGDVNGDYGARWTQLTNGVSTHPLSVSHVYSEVRVWVEDAPVPLDYADGHVTGNTAQLPEEPPDRTFATASSPPLHFEDPTIAKVQIPDLFDNRTSPFVGQFLTIGKNPENGEARQSCPGDPNDGVPSMLVVTGTDPGGFFVTDVTACKVPELQVDSAGDRVRVPEPSGFLPGTFGSIYVYNYSYPEGLYTGDLLWTLSGAVQEFTSTTQLVFPSWSIGEGVWTQSPPVPNKYLQRVTPTLLNGRFCGLDDVATSFITDVICGQNRRNMKLESLESSLVVVRNVRFPEEFANCDLNGDGQVPFFCEAPFGGTWSWSNCDPAVSVDARAECAASSPSSEACEGFCHAACISSQDAHAGKICSERTTHIGFGQFVAEMPGPGPAAMGLDDSLAMRSQTVAASSTSARSAPVTPGSMVQVQCDVPVRFALGGATIVATSSSELLPANTLLRRLFAPADDSVAVLADGTSGSCVVAEHPRMRINIATRDAAPALNVDCDENAANAEDAQDCRNLRGATYDIVGHLRHLQPGRPRWLVAPRDADDICCHPGPGLGCPKPLKACP